MSNYFGKTHATQTHIVPVANPRTMTVMPFNWKTKSNVIRMNNAAVTRNFAKNSTVVNRFEPKPTFPFLKCTMDEFRTGYQSTSISPFVLEMRQLTFFSFSMDFEGWCQRKYCLCFEVVICWPSQWGLFLYGKGKRTMESFHRVTYPLKKVKFWR